MNWKKLFIALVAAFVFAHCFVASSSAQSASPERLVDDYAKAWNSHDGKAFDRLFTDDVIWVAGDAGRTEGSIGKELAEIHTTGWAKETTVTQSAIKVRKLRRDVAVILFHLTLAGQVDGKSMPAVDRAMIVVAVKRSGGWRIAAGQITKPAPRPVINPRPASLRQ